MKPEEQRRADRRLTTASGRRGKKAATKDAIRGIKKARKAKRKGSW